MVKVMMIRGVPVKNPPLVSDSPSTRGGILSRRSIRGGFLVDENPKIFRAPSARGGITLLYVFIIHVVVTYCAAGENFLK